MKPLRFQPLPDDEPTIDLQEFLSRLKFQPAFVEKMRAHYRSFIDVPEAPDTTVARKAAAAALRTLNHHQGAWYAMKALTKAEDILGEPSSDGAWDQMQEVERLMKDAQDHLLDVLEPERTKFVNQVRGMLDTVQAIKAKAERE